jgi:translocator assembly and maintenance protein 41
MSAPLRELLDDVPPVRHAFAYGSAVFHQPGLYAKNAAQPMADYFLVVDDAAKWHDEVCSRVRVHQHPCSHTMLTLSELPAGSRCGHCLQNIARNPQHYGTLAYFGGSSLQCVACNVGANVHFNTLVAWRDRVRRFFPESLQVLQVTSFCCGYIKAM